MRNKFWNVFWIVLLLLCAATLYFAFGSKPQSARGQPGAGKGGLAAQASREEENPAPSSANAADTWAFPDLPFRVTATAQAGLYQRKDEAVACKLDPDKLMQAARQLPGAVLDINSLRVCGEAKGTQNEIPSYPSKDSPELRWRLKGKLEPLTRKTFWIYFDAKGAQPRARPDYPPPGDLAGIENLVRNGGFEEAQAYNGDRPEGWDIVLTGNNEKGEGDIQLVSEPVHGGKRAVRLQPLDNKFCFGQEKIPIQPDTLYRLSAWIKLDERNPVQNLNVAGRAYVFGDQGQGQGVIDFTATPLFGQWTHASHTGMELRNVPIGKVPTNAAYCKLYFFLSCYKGSAVSNIFYLDGVELCEVKAAPGGGKEKLPMVVSLGAVEKKE